jgi:methionyl-tRNA formyltransferase
MLLRGALPIADDDTAGTLADKLAPLGASLMIDTLDRLAAGTLVETPQDPAAATYAPMLRKEDGVVDWTQSAIAVRDRIRGVDPWPAAVTGLGGEALRLFRPVALPGGSSGAAPGEVVAVDVRGLVVACGDGLCAIGEVQAPGRKRMPARAFAAGRGLAAGARLGAPPAPPAGS